MANNVFSAIFKIVTQGAKEAKLELKGIQQAAAGTHVEVGKVSRAYGSVANVTARHHKVLKGAAGATNNQTKAFTKMEQGMTGGLVPAYATVAANIFALTAAFGALSRAADFQVLIQGAELLASQTGRSLKILAAGMQDVTDGAISMKEALTSASIASSAGFNNSTILELTEVARNASVALGRDMTDALNRVFKGAIKAEPELLDELGIILRLDPATRKYAASVGKAVSELTTFEKQQAVVNEVIAQGQEKFSELASVDVNPFTKLSATFSALTQNILGFVNSGLGGVASFFADNIYALAGAFLYFGNTVLKAAIPSLQEFSTKTQEALSKNMAGTQMKQQMSAYIKDFSSGLRDVTLTAENAAFRTQRAFMSVTETLTKTGQMGKKTAERIATAYDSGYSALQKYNRGIKQVNAELLDMQNRTMRGTDAWNKNTKSLIKTRAAMTSSRSAYLAARLSLQSLIPNIESATAAYTNLIATLAVFKTSAFEGFVVGLNEGFLNLIPNIFSYIANIGLATTATLSFGTVAKWVSVILYGLSGAFGALIKFLPLLGAAFIAFQLLAKGFNLLLDLFRDTDTIKKADDSLDSYNKTIKTAIKGVDTYNKKLKNLPKTSKNLTKSLTLQKNVLNELNTSLEETIDNFDGFVFGIGADIDEFTDALERQLDVLVKLGQEDKVNEIRKEFLSDLFISKKEALAAAEATQELTKSMQGLANASFDANEALKTAFDTLDKGMKEVQGDLPALQGAEKALVAISTVIDSKAFSDASIFRSLLVNVSSFQIALTNTAKETDQLGKRIKWAKNWQIEIDKINKEINKIPKAIREMNKADISTGKEFLEFEGFRKLTEQLKRYEDGLKNSGKEADKQVTQILSKYEILQKHLRVSINMQKAFAREAQKLNFELSLPSTTLADKANIINKLSENQIAAAKRQISDAYKTTAAITEGLVATEKQLADTLEKIENLERNKKGEVEDPKLETKLIKQQQKFLKDKADANYQELQTKKLIGETDISIGNTRIKQFNEIRTILADIEAKDFNEILSGKGDIKQADALKQLRNIAEDLKIEFDKTEKVSEKWVDNLVESISSATTLDTILSSLGVSTEGTAKRIRDNEALLNSYEDEIKYIRLGNTLLDDRIDKSAKIRQFKNLANIDELKDAILDRGLSFSEELKARENINKLQEENNQLDKIGTKLIEKEVNTIINKLDLQIKASKVELAFGARLTTIEKQRLEIAKKRLILLNRGVSTKEIDNIVKKMKELDKIKFEIEFGEEIADALNEISGLNDIFKELKDSIEELVDPMDKVSAGFLYGSQIAREFGQESVAAASDAGLVLTQYLEKLQMYLKGGFVDIVDASADAMMGLGSIIRKNSEEGSEAAKAGAVIEGLAAMVKAWNSAIPPYNLPAVAMTAASVGSLLAQMGESPNLGGANNASTKADDYKATFGENRVTGGDSQTNAFVDSLDNLTTINDALYGAEKELKKAIFALKRSFDTVAANLFQAGGSFNVGDISNKFGTSFGTDTSSGFNILGFGPSTTKTNELLAAGLELGVVIEATTDGLSGSINNALLFFTELETKVKKGFFGGTKTSTDIETNFIGLNASLKGSLQDALDNSLGTIAGLIVNFGADLETYFNDEFSLTLPTQQINLMGLSASEQADVVAQYFSDVGNKILGRQLPWLKNWARAGEELLDTLIRLTDASLILNDVFSLAGTSLDALALKDNTFTIEKFDIYDANQQAAIEFWNEQAADAKKIVKIIGKFDGERDSVVAFASKLVIWDDQIDNIAQAITKLNNITDLNIGGGIDAEEWASITSYYEGRVDELGDKADEITKLVYEDWLLERADNARAAWIDALELAFGGTIEDFAPYFERFLETVLSDEELANFLLQSANAAIEGIQKELADITEESFGSRVDKLIASIDGPERLGDVFLKLADLGKLAGTKGAELTEVLASLGNAYADQEEAIEKLDTAVNNFTRDILRQIAEFGTSGKDLDLLSLSFEYEDSLADARTQEGIDTEEAILAVEVLYGLRRVQIIEDYNNEMVESLEAAFIKIDGGILTIIETSKAFNAIAYDSLKIENLKKRLFASFKTGEFATQETLSEVARLLSEIDSSGTDDLTEALGQFITFSEEVPENLAEQIDLANELSDAIVERYNEELQYVEQLKQLSIDIKGYLEDLAISDLSPLTNMQMFNELTARFAQDLVDLSSGDTTVAAEAGERILDDADALLQLGSDLYAIGPQYQELFEYVVGSLQSVDQQLDDKILSETDILNELQKTTIEELDAVKGILTILQKEQESIYEQDLYKATEAIKATNEDIYTVLRENLPDMLETMNSWTGPAPVSDIVFENEKAEIPVLNIEYMEISAPIVEAIQSADNTASEIEAINEVQGTIADEIEVLNNISSILEGDESNVSQQAIIDVVFSIKETNEILSANLPNMLTAMQEVVTPEPVTGEIILDDAALLQLGSDLSAIGPQYQELFEYVVRSLESVDQQLDDKIINEAASLNEIQQTTLQELEVIKGIFSVLEARQADIFAIGPQYRELFEYVVTALQSVDQKLNDKIVIEASILSEIQLNTGQILEGIKNVSSILESKQDDSYTQEFLDAIIAIGETNRILSDNLPNILNATQSLIVPSSTAQEVPSDDSNVLQQLSNAISTIGPQYKELFTYIITSLQSIDQQLDTKIVNEAAILQEVKVASERQLDTVRGILGTLEARQADIFAIGPQYRELFEYVVGSLQSVDQKLNNKIVNESNVLNDIKLINTEEREISRTILGILQAGQASTYKQELIDATQIIREANEGIYAVLSSNLPNILLATQAQTSSSIFDMLPRFGEGTQEVPFDQLAVVHKGEMIVPAAESGDIRDGNSALGNGDPVFDTASIVNAISILTQIVADGNEEMVDQQERHINVSRDTLSNQQSNTNTGTVGIL